MALKIGSLFSGYGGLDIAVEHHFNAETVWHAEFENAPSKVLAHHWPGVPNHHDVSTVDWSAVEPVDIITGGFPCQDVSMAGKRAGMVEGTRSNLWGAMRTAIETIRPQYAVIENVRGLLSAKAQSDSDLEQRPGFMGDGPNVTLRALGRVLGDLADIGYDAQWHGLRAADIGAPHGRYRIFILATDPRRLPGATGRVTAPGQAPRRRSLSELVRCGRTQVATNPKGTERVRPEPADLGASLGPASELGERIGSDVVTDAGSTTIGQQPRGSFAKEAGTGGSDGLSDHRGEQSSVNWGPYLPAITRWENVLDRPAPLPSETSRTGRPMLSPAFVEWMMGLDYGHVTDIEGISRADQITMLGNGVVPQQALAALQQLTYR